MAVEEVMTNTTDINLNTTAENAINKDTFINLCVILDRAVYLRSDPSSASYFGMNAQSIIL